MYRINSVDKQQFIGYWSFKFLHEFAGFCYISCLYSYLIQEHKSKSNATIIHRKNVNLDKNLFLNTFFMSFRPVKTSGGQMSLCLLKFLQQEAPRSCKQRLKRTNMWVKQPQCASSLYSFLTLVRRWVECEIVLRSSMEIWLGCFQLPLNVLNVQR